MVAAVGDQISAANILAVPPKSCRDISLKATNVKRSVVLKEDSSSGDHD